MTASDLAVLFDGWGYQVSRVAISLVWQSSIVFVFVWGMSFWLRQYAAKVRHALWFAGIMVTPLIPLAMLLIHIFPAPDTGIAIIPSYTPADVRSYVPPVMPDLSEYSDVEQSVLSMTETMPVQAKSHPWAAVIPLYLSGAGTIVLLIVIGRRRIARWKRYGHDITDRRICAIADMARTQTGVTRNVPFIEHDDVPAPFTAGVNGPAVLLPSGYAASLSEDDFYALAVHELSHIRRRDPMILTIVSFMRAILFFHPLVWYAARRVATEAEYACDEAVVAAVSDPVVYAEQLVRLARRFPRPMVSAEIAAGFVWNRHAFVRRIEAILSGHNRRIRSITKMAGIGITVSLCAAIAVAVSAPLTERQNADSSPEQEALLTLQQDQHQTIPDDTAEPSELAQAPSVRRPTSPTPPVSPRASRNVGPEVPESLRGLVADGPSPDILVGDWLNREYYDRLLATRSPKAAIEGVTNTSMEIEKNAEEQVYEWLQSFNFHEGLRWRITGLATTDDDAMFKPVLAEYQDSSLEPADGMFHFEEPYPPDTITWHSSSGETMDTYVRIPGGIDRFVNRNIIAGQYVDEDGERYSFTEDGVAVWPDTTFTFYIQIDTMFSEGDYFFVGKSHEERTRPVYRSYGFSWEDSMLYLYYTYYGSDEVILRRASEPFAVLTPVAMEGRSEGANSISTFDMLEGEWLNREYFNLLLETRSPKAANDVVYKTSMEIEKNTDENVYKWMQSYNFHEGLSWRITGLEKANEDNMYRPVLAEYQYSMLEHADGMFQFEEPYPPDMVTWHSLSGEGLDTYIRIPGGIDRFVTRTVIAGQYEDEDGGRYTFTEDGVAVWPDTTFTFQLSVDTVLSEGDFFYVGKTYQERTLPVYQSYGFMWDDDRLLLFDTFETPDRLMLHQASEPFAVLTPVTMDVRSEGTGSSVPLDMLEGDWLNRVYIDTLLATRSPRAATEAVSWSYMTFEKDNTDNLYEWLQGFNFHEGLRLSLTGLSATGEENMYRPVLANDQNSGVHSTNARFSIPRPFPPEEIEYYSDIADTWGGQDEFPATYVHIPEGLDQFLAHTVIAGQYVDEAGEQYTFTEDGVAVWPDTTFTFSILTDTMFSGDTILSDYTYATPDGQRIRHSYRYVWQDGLLTLYHTFYESSGNIRRASEPFAVLRPLED